MLISIEQYYAKQVGINDEIKISYQDNSGVASYQTAPTEAEDHYNVTVLNYTATVNKTLTDVNNTVNSWVHEKKHEDDKSTFKNINHIYAIITQIKDPSFENTTTDFKMSLGTYAAELLNRALAEKEPIEEVQKRISEFNNTAISKYTELTYIEELNEVSAPTLPQVKMSIDSNSKAPKEDGKK